MRAILGLASLLGEKLWVCGVLGFSVNAGMLEAFTSFDGCSFGLLRLWLDKGVPGLCADIGVLVARSDTLGLCRPPPEPTLPVTSAGLGVRAIGLQVRPSIGDSFDRLFDGVLGRQA